MRFLIEIRIDGTTKRTYPIDAQDEAQAKERLKLRLPPHQRDTIVIDAITIDPASIANEDPYGIFGGE